MTDQEIFRWWELSPARSLNPTTYICPLCDQQLQATSEHMLLLPEGDPSRRRHAHTFALPRRAARAGSLHRTNGARRDHPRRAHATDARAAAGKRAADDDANGARRTGAASEIDAQ